MIRVIALDIDGTITDQNRRLETSAVGAIRKAEESGIPICLATGNLLCFAKTASILIGTSGPIIAEDGGVIYNPKNKEMEILNGHEEVEKAVKLLEENFDNIQHTESSDILHSSRALERTIDASEARELFKENGLNVTAVDTGFSIHIKGSNVNKGEALKKVASLIGCSISEIAAIGDAQNDVEMLQLAGQSFTPANSSQEAKEASSYTTKEPFGSGVQEIIDKILESE